MENESRGRLVIFAEADVDVIEQLAQLEGWELGTETTLAGPQQVLRQHGITIHLRVIAPNVVVTSNVLPHDNQDDFAGGNAGLRDLEQRVEHRPGLQSSFELLTG